MVYRRAAGDGLPKPSLVPDRPQRELRDLTRQRAQLLGDRLGAVNRDTRIEEVMRMRSNRPIEPTPRQCNNAAL